MINETNLHHRIIKTGIVCSVVICALVFAMALYAHFYVPGSTLLSPEMLTWRMSGGIISYFLAAGFIFCAKFFFQDRLSDRVSVPLLGSVILISFVFSYFFIQGYLGEINCAQEVTFGECYRLSTEQTILAAALAFMVSSVIGGAVYFVLGRLHKTFLNRSTLK